MKLRIINTAPRTEGGEPGAVASKVFMLDSSVRECSPLRPGQIVDFSGELEGYGKWLLESLPYTLEVTDEPSNRELYDLTLGPAPDLEVAKRARDTFVADLDKE